MSLLPIPTDPREIRTYIKYHVLCKKSVLEGYKKLCTIIPQYNYSDYKYYHDHFSAGGSLNEPMKLDALPVDVLEKILEKVDVKQRFKIRLVSRKMLAIVDQLKIIYDTIDIGCWRESINVIVWFEDLSWTTKSWTDFGENARENFVEIALHLKSILKPTMIRMKRFRILSRNVDHVKPIVEMLVSITNSKNSKFHAESTVIHIQEQNIALLFLSILKPKILEELNIGCGSGYGNGPDDYNMDQIKDADQFKKAKNVELWGVIQSSDLELFWKFKGFYVTVQSMKADDVIRLRDKLLTNSTFTNCTIRLMTSFESTAEIARILGEEFPNDGPFGVKCRWDIAGVLQFLIQRNRIIADKDHPNALDEKYPERLFLDRDEEEFEDDDSDIDDEEGDDEEYNSSDDAED